MCSSPQLLLFFGHGAQGVNVLLPAKGGPTDPGSAIGEGRLAGTLIGVRLGRSCRVIRQRG
jgi:hypothetical protein